jgi:hypothetical protein
LPTALSVAHLKQLLAHNPINQLKRKRTSKASLFLLVTVHAACAATPPGAFQQPVQRALLRPVLLPWNHQRLPP